MTSIDEIMGAVGRHGDDCIRDADAASASFEALRELIAAALADAERKGAEAMRERAAVAALASGMDQHNGRRGAAQDAREVGSLCAHAIRAVRALPLPTGERKDEPLVCDVCGAECADPWHYSSGERRHMHACDACWPGVRKQGGGRQALPLTDEQIKQARNKALCDAPDGVLMGRVAGLWHPELRELSRAIETAVLAANGLEVRRGS